MYVIRTDPARRLIEIELTGFLDFETMAAFQRDQRAAVARLNCPPGTHLVLVDVTNSPLQSQRIVTAAQTFLKTADPKAARLAFVAGGSATRMQARRLLVREGFTVVGTLAEARDFLFAPDPPADTDQPKRPVT